MNNLIAENKGLILTKQLTEADIPRVYLSNLVNDGLLFQLFKDAINHNHMAEAFYQTVKKRGTQAIIIDKELIFSEIYGSDNLLRIWNRYQKEYKYAEAVEWKTVLKAVGMCLKMCEQ